MGVPIELQAVYSNQYGGRDQIRTILLPETGLGAGTGLGATLTSGAALTYGALADIALPAAIVLKSRVVGICVDTPSGVATFAIQIGKTTSLGVAYANAAAVTAAGAAAILGSIRRTIGYHIAVAVGVYGGFIPFATPIAVAAGEGVIGRISTVAGGDTINVKIVVEQNFR